MRRESRDTSSNPAIDGRPRGDGRRIGRRRGGLGRAPSAAPSPPREWRDYAGGPDSSRFVAATQITKANVSQLQVAWTYPAGQTDFNPLVVRGVVYGRGPNGTFVALDAATGKRALDARGRPGLQRRAA